jgi:hypothetical protein
MRQRTAQRQPHLGPVDARTGPPTFRVPPLLDAPTALTSLAGWIEDYNDNHPHSGL